MSTLTLGNETLDALIREFRRPAVRLSRPGDVLPAGSQVDMLETLDHNWCWVYERKGEIQGLLLACPCHGAALLLRLWVDSQAGPHAANQLLHRVRRDTEARGMKGFITLLDLEKPAERRLQALAERWGGKTVKQVMLLSGSWEKTRRR